jgi:hypothetical protein
VVVTAARSSGDGADCASAHGGVDDDADIDGVDDEQAGCQSTAGSVNNDDDIALGDGRSQLQLSRYHAEFAKSTLSVQKLVRLGAEAQQKLLEQHANRNGSINKHALAAATTRNSSRKLNARHSLQHCLLRDWNNTQSSPRQAELVQCVGRMTTQAASKWVEICWDESDDKKNLSGLRSITEGLADDAELRLPYWYCADTNKYILDSAEGEHHDNVFKRAIYNLTGDSDDDEEQGDSPSMNCLFEEHVLPLMQPYDSRRVSSGSSSGNTGSSERSVRTNSNADDVAGPSVLADRLAQSFGRVFMQPQQPQVYCQIEQMAKLNSARDAKAIDAVQFTALQASIIAGGPTGSGLPNGFAGVLDILNGSTSANSAVSAAGGVGRGEGSSGSVAIDNSMNL